MACRYVENKAQLPRGIAAIRPHLQQVDDVPLLVPLFSDCSPAATQEMIQVMQENGKVRHAMRPIAGWCRAMPCCAVP